MSTTKQLMPCPDCKGEGTVPRPKGLTVDGSVDNLGITDNFPALCNRCNGSGKVPWVPPPAAG